MTEVLFILTTIFVAYVVYVIVNEHKSTTKPVVSEIKPEVQVVVEQPKPQITIPTAQPVAAQKTAPTAQPVAAKKTAPTVQPVAAKKTAPTTQPAAAKKTAPTAMQNTAKGSVRDPKTGEIASISSNYRFTKRWVKEALVAEGLLEKVYKNNELDAATETAIKDALVKLEAMDKYRA